MKRIDNINIGELPYLTLGDSSELWNIKPNKSCLLEDAIIQRKWDNLTLDERVRHGNRYATFRENERRRLANMKNFHLQGNMYF